MKKISSHKKIIVILGPTSSGKSELATKLAKQYNGEIISADSRQIYRSMDLGTGKIEGQWEEYPGLGRMFVYEGIIHHLIDFVMPQEEYNISHFKKDCTRLIDEISSRGKLPIICGGTGFWISSVVDDITFPEVKPDLPLRQELEQKNKEELYAMLKQCDPKRAASIDPRNKIRVIRAIEICDSLGKVPKTRYWQSNRSEAKKLFQKITSQKNRNHQFLQIGIDYPKEIIADRIKNRLDKRFALGMVDEVKNLKNNYTLSWKKIQSFGLGYYWIPLFLEKKISHEELKERVFIAEKQYAKRQKTWFKRDKRIKWLNDYQDINNQVRKFLAPNSFIKSLKAFLKL